ncbi:ABC transporter substrate-binding protein [Glutamicibacter sp. NPDC127525]|uniref:ABC transporter substrate-binding protein n=1 Tax=unclassified Glutamicibacter TaxID=2627139 RepID=UPI00363B66C8
MSLGSKSIARRVAILATVAFSLTACVNNATPTADIPGCETTYPVKYQWYEGNVINIQAAVAEKKGFFTENCIAGTPVTIASTPASMTALVGGEVDFINSGPDNIPPARAQGIDLKVVSNILTRPIYSLVVREEKVGATFKETLNNIQTVGVVAVGGSNEFHAHVNFSDNGIDPASKDYIALGQTSTMLAGLENNKVDAVYFYGTAQDVAVAKNYGVMVSDTRRSASAKNPVPETLKTIGKTSLLWAAQDSFLKENPEAGKRFKETMTKTSDWIRDPKNRAELYQIMKDQLSVPADLPNADKVFEESVDTYAANVDAALDLSALQSYIDFTETTREIEITEKAADMVWSDTQK